MLADIEPYSALIVAVEHKKPFIKEHLEAQFQQLLSIVEQAFPNKDTKRTTAHLMDATMPYHYPQLVKNGIEYDKSRELASLLDVLVKGLAVE